MDCFCVCLLLLLFPTCGHAYLLFYFPLDSTHLRGGCFNFFLYVICFVIVVSVSYKRFQDSVNTIPHGLPRKRVQDSGVFKNVSQMEYFYKH